MNCYAHTHCVAKVINNNVKKIVIYPGRFQPMLRHHAEVYSKLQTEFPDADIYVGTSDKVELPNSPFKFKEKQMIADAHGVPANRVLLAPRPYHKDDYAKYFDENNTIIIFAVGEKDMDRFPFPQIDPKTGLDMTVKGERRAKYYQKINTLSDGALPMSMRGYITLAPTIKLGDEVASASAFRSALKQAADLETAKKLFVQQFGSFNQKVFDLIYDKITGADMKNMNEQINRLKKLAGIAISESAPIQFSSTADPKTAKFLPANAASSKMSVANRFPRGADVNDFKLKQDEFLKALMRSPESLLSEINERLDPKDANSLAVSGKLNEILELMYSKNIGITRLPADLRQFVLSLTVNAVRNMNLVAGDDAVEFDDEDEPIREQSTDDEPDFFDDLNDFEEDELNENNFEDVDFNKLSDQAKKVLSDIALGDFDVYEVLARPKTPSEKEAAAYLQDMYDDISAERGLHPDDDVDDILDHMHDQLEVKFTKPVSENHLYSSKERFTSSNGVPFLQNHREDEEHVEFVYPGGKFFLYYDDNAMQFDTQEATATDSKGNNDPAATRKLQSMGPIANDKTALGNVVDSLMSVLVRGESMMDEQEPKEDIEQHIRSFFTLAKKNDPGFVAQHSPGAYTISHAPVMYSPCEITHKTKDFSHFKKFFEQMVDEFGAKKTADRTGITVNDNGKQHLVWADHGSAYSSVHYKQLPVRGESKVVEQASKSAVDAAIAELKKLAGI